MSDEEFTQEDRRKCEIRLHRLLAWVGAEFTENLELPHGIDHLRNFIFTLLTKKQAFRQGFERYRCAPA